LDLRGIRPPPFATLRNVILQSTIIYNCLFMSGPGTQLQCQADICLAVHIPAHFLQLVERTNGFIPPTRHVLSLSYACSSARVGFRRCAFRNFFPPSFAQPDSPWLISATAPCGFLVQGTACLSLNFLPEKISRITPVSSEVSAL